jgi:hypothetical protein
VRELASSSSERFVFAPASAAPAKICDDPKKKRKLDQLIAELEALLE